MWYGSIAFAIAQSGSSELAPQQEYDSGTSSSCQIFYVRTLGEDTGLLLSCTPPYYTSVLSFTVVLYIVGYICTSTDSYINVSRSNRHDSINCRKFTVIRVRNKRARGRLVTVSSFDKPSSGAYQFCSSDQST
jgi:hypothetical protein